MTEDEVWDYLLARGQPPHSILASRLGIPPEGVETLQRVVEWHQLNCAECAAWGHVHGTDWEQWVYRPGVTGV